MKNCGAKAHAMAAAKDIPKAMVRLCERAPNLDVRDKCLELTQEWATNLRRCPEFAMAYSELKGRGYRFPALAPRSSPTTSNASSARQHWSTNEGISEEDRRAIAQAIAEAECEAQEDEIRQAEMQSEMRRRMSEPQPRGPALSGIYAGNIPTGLPVEVPPHLASRPSNHYVARIAGVGSGDSELQRAIRESEAMAAEHAARTTATSAPVTYTAADVEKLKGDVAVARHSLEMFTSVLDACVASTTPAPSDISRELATQCRAMHPRLIELISNAEDEGLLMSAIELNDALTRQIERFNLLVRAASGDATACASLAPPTPAPPTSTQTVDDILSNLDGLYSAPFSGGAPVSKSANPFGDAVPTQAVQTPVTYSMYAGPSSFGNPFESAAMTAPRSSGPDFVPAMQTNPAFSHGDDYYAPPQGARMARPMSGSPASPGTSPGMRGAPPAPGTSPSRGGLTPFADLASIAAFRARRTSEDGGADGDAAAKI